MSAHTSKRPRGKVAVSSGQVLSFIRANGEWMAVVAAFSSGPSDLVLSEMVRIADLKGAARRKAERWTECLA